MIYSVRSVSASEISKRRILLVVKTRRNVEICKSRSVLRFVGYVDGVKMTVKVCIVFVVNLYESDYLLIRFQIGYNITIGLHVLRLIGGWNWFGAVSFGGRWFVILLSIFGF